MFTKMMIALLIASNILVIAGVARAENVQVCDASMTHCSTHVIATTPVHAPKGTVK
jgi:hypothetical protein